jgi:hypothetical protein
MTVYTLVSLSDQLQKACSEGDVERVAFLLDIKGDETDPPEELKRGDHAAMVLLCSYLAEEGAEASSIVEAVEKPWKFRREYILARGEQYRRTSQRAVRWFQEHRPALWEQWLEEERSVRSKPLQPTGELLSP